MNIAGMRVRIVFQKSMPIIDEYGNHKSEWSDYYRCWASAVTGGIKNEQEAAAHTKEEDKLDFTVRYCSETAPINEKEYRIKLKDRIYNIVNIDEMGFKHNSRKFHAELVER